jgi:hypothetical protein
MPERTMPELDREQTDLMKVLQQLSRDEVDAVIAASELVRCLGKLETARIRRNLVGPLLDRYLGHVLDLIEGIGVRLRIKV